MSVAPPRIYSYVRFSSQTQLTGDSLRRQNELINRYVKQRGLEIDFEFRYVDPAKPAFKGQNLKTGKFRFFLEAIREGKVPVGSILLVESLDRLTRLEPHEALPVFLEIVNSGVTIVTLIDGREHRADAPADEKLTNLIISTTTICRAHEESLTKSRRLKERWEEKRKQIGEKRYTGKTPSWITFPKDETEPKLIEDKAKTVKEMFTLCLKGFHAESIARKFHAEKKPIVGRSEKWSFSYVAQTLRNPAVTGEFTPNVMVNGKRKPAREVIEGYYPKVVSRDVFNRVQAIMDARTKNRKGGRVAPKGNNLFRKMLFCGYCGAPVYRTAKGRYYKGELRRTLLCRNAKEGTGCFYVGWEYDEFVQCFLKSATELRKAIGDAAVDNRKTREELNTLLGERSEVDKKISNILQIAEAGAGTEANVKALLQRISELQDRKEELVSEITKVERKLASVNDGDRPISRLKTVLGKIETEEGRLKAADLISQLFDRIELFPAGTKMQFAKMKRMHEEFVRKNNGKIDGRVSAAMRENFDRRKVRFLQAYLNVPGVAKRWEFRSDGKLVEARLDLVQDTPEDGGPSKLPTGKEKEELKELWSIYSKKKKANK